MKPQTIFCHYYKVMLTSLIPWKCLGFSQRTANHSELLACGTFLIVQRVAVGLTPRLVALAVAKLPSRLFWSDFIIAKAAFLWQANCLCFQWNTLEHLLFHRGNTILANCASLAPNLTIYFHPCVHSVFNKYLFPPFPPSLSSLHSSLPLIPSPPAPSPSSSPGTHILPENSSCRPGCLQTRNGSLTLLGLHWCFLNDISTDYCG